MKGDNVNMHDWWCEKHPESSVCAYHKYKVAAKAKGGPDKGENVPKHPPMEEIHEMREEFCALPEHQGSPFCVHWNNKPHDHMGQL